MHTFLTSFFFNDTATNEIYTLSLHDALPISDGSSDDMAPLRKAYLRTFEGVLRDLGTLVLDAGRLRRCAGDRKSTRLNSSHANISYAVFCLKKKIQTLV